MILRRLLRLLHRSLVEPLRIRALRPLRARVLYPLRDRIIYRLDRFLGWPPYAQIGILLFIIVLFVSAFGVLHSRFIAPGEGTVDALWWALTRFMDGGTMADDSGHLPRSLALAVTGGGVLILAFLTGTFASKMSERIEDLRSGRSPVVERRHVLVLGFDARVLFLARELGRSHRRLKLVVLAAADKPRVEALLRRYLHQAPGSRVRPICRIGDPHSSGDLLRLAAPRTRAIIAVAPPHLDDVAARNWLLLTLLSTRHAVGGAYAGPIIVDARRAEDRPVLELVGEDGLCGAHQLRVRALSSDDIIARVLAHSARQAGIYFVLREMLSYHGNELYLEDLPAALSGCTFDEAHARIIHGVAIGVLRGDGAHLLVPAPGDPTPLRAGDRLIVLEQERGACQVGGSLPAAPPALPNAAPEGPQRMVILGANRTLPCLITELCRILPPGSHLTLGSPARAAEEPRVKQAIASCHGRVIERDPRDPEDIVRAGAACLFAADAVIILGCEDEQDPAGDASALQLLLQLRHAQRAQGRRIRRVVTEVRDPGMAQQIRVSPTDFLVGTDVVAMVLARAALDPALSAAYREIFEPAGAEIFLRPRSLYAVGPATFAAVMAAARQRGEVAIGFSLGGAGARGREVLPVEGQQPPDETSPVLLNPPRDHPVPEGPDISIVVLGHDGPFPA